MRLLGAIAIAWMLCSASSAAAQVDASAVDASAADASITDAGTTDAAAADGMPAAIDASAGSDSGFNPPPLDDRSGCNCRAAVPTSGGAATMVLAIGAVLVGRRRRR